MSYKKTPSSPAFDIPPQHTVKTVKNDNKPKNFWTSLTKYIRTHRIHTLIFSLSVLVLLCVMAVAKPWKPIFITSQPKSVTVNTGEELNVKIRVRGKDLSYEWLISDPDSASYIPAGQYSSVYTKKADYFMNGSTLCCLITDSKGNSLLSDPILVLVDSPISILKQPYDINVGSGENAVVEVTAEGDDLKYTWYYKNAGNSAFIKSTINTTNVYSIEMTHERDGRQLYCVITDSQGNTVQTNTVTINMTSFILITSHPSDITVNNGETAVAEVKAEGKNLNYTWYYKNQGEKEYTESTLCKSNIYSVEMTPERDGREIYCLITDSEGHQVQSHVIKLSMNHAIRITKQPQSATVVKGKQAVVQVSAEGKNLSYTWYYKNKGEQTFVKSTVSQTAAYSVTMDASRDGRELYCVVSDPYGNQVQTQTVTIYMKEPIQIVAQPKSTTVSKGSNAVVEVKAEGSNLKYVWYYKDSDDKEFKVSTLCKTNVYSVEMNNDRNGRQLYCVITDKDGNTVKTNTVTISMK